MVHTIFFDLDNTLYSRDSGLWEAISERIDLYITEVLLINENKVGEIRDYCRQNYHTSLQGLRSLYQINESEYLAFVHDIDLSKTLTNDGRLTKMLASISQRKIIFTNSDSHHANRVLNFFGIRSHFDIIVDLLSLNPYHKPDPEAFEKALLLSGLHASKGCLFIDDMIENVEQGQKMGFLSILVGESTNNFQNIPNIFMLPEYLESLD